MNTIEKLIFDRLASHQPVLLPGIGAFGVVSRGARDGHGPTNHVFYSLESDNDIPSVTSLGIDADDYHRWSEVARHNDELHIEGVGRLVLGEFTPSAELDRTLNPLENEPAPTVDTAHTEHTEHTAPHKHTAAHHAAGHPHAAHTAHHTHEHHTHTAPPPPKPHRNRLTNILLIVAILLMLALLCLLLCRRSGERMERKAAAPRVDTVALTPVLATASDTVVSTAKYHLIVGSFADPSHAEAQASHYRRAYPNLIVETLDNGSGRTLVSVFGSDSRREAYNRFYRIAEQTGNWDMWVFERD